MEQTRKVNGQTEDVRTDGQTDGRTDGGHDIIRSVFCILQKCTYLFIQIFEIFDSSDNEKMARNEIHVYIIYSGHSSVVKGT